MSSSLITNSDYLISLNSGANTLSILGTVAITGNLSVTGNATLSGNILGDRIQNGTTSIDIQTINGNANVTVGGVSNVAVFATTGTYVAGVVSATGNITGNYFVGNGSQLTGIVSSYGNANVVANLAALGSNPVSTTGNITAGNIIAGNLDAINLVINSISSDDSTFVTIEDGLNVVGEVAVSGNITGSNLVINRISSDDSTFVTIEDGLNVTSGFISAPESISLTAGSATWILGTNDTLTLPGGSKLRPVGANLDLVAGTGAYVNLITSDGNSYVGVDNGGGYIATAGGTWSFGTTGNLTAPGAISAAGNVTVTGNLNVTGTAGNVVTKSSGAWTVPTGNSTQSFTVDSNYTYQMWVTGNIPNGIIAWNALATVTNNNVPVIGQQFAWNYEGGGNLILLTSIPAQIIGTAGAISNAAPAVANTNVFSFGINNASGNTVTVSYGWVKIS